MAYSPKEKVEELRKSFFNFTITRPVAIFVVVLGIVIFGIISYVQLPLNLMPDMTYPSLTVRTEYLGTAPEEIETSISRPIEQALGVVDNLVSISSISKAEQSDVILDFTWDTDMDKATADLREKLDQVFLPLDAKKPLILRFDPSLDPIIRVGLYGDASLTYLRYIAEEELKRALEAVDGVAAVKVKGGLEEEIRVEIDESQITLLGLDIQTVRERLAQENVNLAGGNLKEGQTEYLVRTLNEFRNVKEIEDLIVGYFNGALVRIKDIAKVHRTHKEREIITRIKGTESVELEIFKEADANIVAVAHRVKNRLYGTAEQQKFVAELKQKKNQKKEKKAAEKGQKGPKKRRGRGGSNKAQMTSFLEYSLPKGVGVQTLSDQSIFIENSVEEVKGTAVKGGLLAIIVLFIFLRRMGPTIIIALSIPISIITTFAPMKIFDVSLNIMSLGGLALGIGMLVDNSIVVLESIARCREEGDDLFTATLRGLKEVGGAVIASTLTTIAVFLPIAFVEGVAGQIFGDMALTVVFSLLASLAVALFFIPMLSSRSTKNYNAQAGFGQSALKFVLNFKIKEQIDNFFSEENEDPFTEKVAQFFPMLFKVCVDVFMRFLKIITAYVLATLKAVGLVIAVLLSPILFLLRFFINEFRVGRVISQFALNEIKIMDIDKTWEGFTAFKSAPVVYTSYEKRITTLKEKGILGKLFILLKLVLYTPLILIRYIVSAFLELIFRVIHTTILLLGLFIAALYFIARIILTPFSKVLVALFNIMYGAIEKAYPRFLKGALENSSTLLGGVAVAFFITVYFLVPKLGSELIPEVHQGEFYVEMTLPVGTAVEDTDRRISKIQEEVEKLSSVEKVASVAGTDKGSSSKSEEGEHTARLTVTVTKSSNIKEQENIAIDDIRAIISNYSGITANIARPTLFSFKTPIEIHIKGYNLEKLQDLGYKIEEEMSNVVGVVDAKSNLQRGNPEVQIYYDRVKIARQNLNVRNVASIVRNKIRGDVATEFKDEDRRIDILVRLREDDKKSIDNLRRLVINPGADIAIPLSAVADIRINEGPSEIRRVSQQRTAVITANIIPGYDLKSINDALYDMLENMDIPNEFSYELAGQNKEMETSLNSLLMALSLAIFLVYIVMASQFESFIHPFIIIFTIPLAIIGVVLFLYLFNIPISVVVFLGLIMLAGIVVNNAIVLVDYINYLMDEGKPKFEAIMEAGKARLRPIFMTTATTVLGLLPMAIGLGDGAEIRTPMAITVIVGLLSSTLLTLIVIPTVYNIVTREKKLNEAVN